MRNSIFILAAVLSIFLTSCNPTTTVSDREEMIEKINGADNSVDFINELANYVNAKNNDQKERIILKTGAKEFKVYVQKQAKGNIYIEFGHKEAYLTYDMTRKFGSMFIWDYNEGVYIDACDKYVIMYNIWNYSDDLMLESITLIPKNQFIKRISPDEKIF